MKRKPSMVVGLDFLFWYFYGAPLDGKERFLRLEKGLGELDKLHNTYIVIGDIPDMHGADPNMLSEAQIPEKEMIEEANKRIAEWAKGKKNVVIVPLAEWVKKLKAKGIELAPEPWEKGEKVKIGPREALLQDRLHPSCAGAVAVAIKLVRFIRKKVKGIGAKDFYIPLSRLEEELVISSRKGKKVRNPGVRSGKGK